jgi:hypothetical protein
MRFTGQPSTCPQEALCLDLHEIRQLTPTADHKNQVTAAHLDGH